MHVHTLGEGGGGGIVNGDHVNGKLTSCQQAILKSSLVAAEN